MRIKKILIAIFTLFCATQSIAQQVNSLYFLDNTPFQQNINPALQPEREGYFALPIIGFGQLSVGNNSLTMQNVIYQPKGQKQMVTFLHPEFGDKGKFFKSIKKTALINFDYQINLLSFGFRYKQKNYFTFNIAERIELGLGLPQDIFKLILYGSPHNGEGNDYESYKNVFNLKKLGISATAYTEIGAGVAFNNNAKVQYGLKVKFLLGSANAQLKNKKLNLTTGIDQWNLDGNTTLQLSSPIQINGNFEDFVMPKKIIDYVKPSGYGGAIDLGIVYNIKKNIRFTAAITDLGLIYWMRNPINTTNEINFSFKGFEVDGMSLFENFNGNVLLDTLKNNFLNSIDLGKDKESLGYISMTTAKLNVGFDWSFYKEKFGISLLSRTMLFNNNIYEEVTASFKIKPVNWFNMNLNYSILNGHSSLGAGMGLRAGPILFFFAADYIPLSYAKYGKAPLPYQSSSFNLAGGITIVWGKRDKDKDGIADKFDLCPMTPRDVTVDSVGCPIDTDGDSVPDYLDECPDTPVEAFGTIDTVGCPIDSDGDGVPDYLDQCPDTPIDVAVDSVGCPVDTDSDGVPDYLDKCPDTPVAAYGMIDSDGCPVDSDGDGVPDYLDQCPNTPAKAYGMTDSVGCPLDSDKDGVFDYLDAYPDVAGPISNKGCPEIKKEVTKLFSKALQGIQFESGKAVLLKVSFPILNDIAKIMHENPNYNLTIAGHTDNTGDPIENLDLSDKRALSVKLYLIGKGVDASRMTSVGYGDTAPIADNNTSKGRNLNRRVELNVNFKVKVLE